MATTQTPQGPVDRDAERATLAAGLWHHAWWLEVRATIAPNDYGIAAHQAIAHALDQLADIGPFLPTRPDQWEDGYWPSSLHARAGAVSALADLDPIAAIIAIAKFADGRHLTDARTVADHSATRWRIAELHAELGELTA